ALPFKAVRQRLGRKSPDGGLLAAVPVSFIAFDVLAAGGELVIDEPWTDRHARLEALAWPARGTRMAPHRLAASVGGIEAAFESARAAGHEGLGAKAPSSTYAPRRRGGPGVQLKRPLPP